MTSLTPELETLESIYERMEKFEASESRANTGTGSRREGEQFEVLITSMWEALITHFLSKGLSGESLRHGSGRWVRISNGKRSLYLPDGEGRSLPLTEHGERWLQLHYLVSDLVAAYPGEPAAIERYAPLAGSYAGASYPRMYSRLQTRFDGTVLMEQDGVLTEKLLLEYKTAKSSRGMQIDGNAHERLSFQIMQYLEVATRYPKCSLYVLTNGAYIRYRNKYHVNFKVQADRLSAFSWFSMNFLSHREEYRILVSRLISWLEEPRTK